MTNLLTPTQAANALRCPTDDPRMLDLLPQIDAFIQRATGRNWTQDASINPVAVSAATMLLVQWFDNPSMLGGENNLSFGLLSALLQLEAEAAKYRKYEFEGINGAGSIRLRGALEGDSVIRLVGVYGATGDQSSAFEAAISEENQIEQISTSDLSEKRYVVILKSPAVDIVP